MVAETEPYEERARFWSDRYRKIGHTGWKDSRIYPFDQAERLALISKEVDLLDPGLRRAIDFGCGTGDFGRLLLEKDFRVWGYDPYVQPAIQHPNFTYCSTFDDLKGIDDESIGLVLSVTVLDHILESSEFEEVLMMLNKKTCTTGVLLMVEYALDENGIFAGASSSYQALRNLGQWREYLQKTGWQIEDIRPVSHPVEAPSPGYLAYRQALPTKLLNKLVKIGALKPVADPLLKGYARSVMVKHGVGKVKRSPLKLIMCTKPACDSK